jgi:hypothetical protein
MARTVPSLAAILPIALLASLPAAAADDVPDLRVWQLTVEQIPSVSVPLRLKVAVMIRNDGGPTGKAPHVTRLSCRQKGSDPWQTLEQWNGTPLLTGGIARYEKVCDFPLTGRARLTFRAEVDAGGSLEERSEGNNAKTVTGRFIAGVPDLAVEDLEAGLVKVDDHGAWKCRVAFDVANVGTGPAGRAFEVTLKVRKDEGGYSEMARWTVSGLAPGERRRFRRNARFEGVESLLFSVSVDPRGAVLEKAKENNLDTSDVVEPEEKEEDD